MIILQMNTQNKLQCDCDRAATGICTGENQMCISMHFFNHNLNLNENDL